MADFLRLRRASARSVTRGTYALRPVRSSAMRVATWMSVCVACAAAGAAAMHGYATRVTSDSMPCAAVPSHDGLDDALARTQLALRQEAASRASVQRSADALTAEVRELQAHVLFLQAQSRSRR
ncbi:hypothetical protein PPMP20_29555 [Paraburkholderia phymatum]|uniref:Uncharacterized protein n=1 Tax=Paraburkholderia phymatum (strain DSM 17167 / CIP 108236 / LMG 21445 / STM815) TaxID=391038 RepID=B2JRS3_PARP8|nr:hypothetical protein [Paraburkholderia phymatum]ACC73842.1 conserved hypothetical protein [Paraburkholderia phymatum STM815]